MQGQIIHNGKKTSIPSWLLYAMVAMTAFYPCLFGGKTYFDDDLLNDYSITQQFLKGALLQGHIPLWMPFQFGGQPFFAEIPKMTFYPLLYPCLFLGLGTSFGLFFSLHCFLACLGMDVWLGLFGLSREARWAGALSFGLGGIFWGEIVHPNIFAALAWAPWFFAALEWMVRSLEFRSAFGAGLILTLMGTTFYPEVLLGIFYGGSLYLLLRIFQERPNLGQLIRAIPAFILGALPLLLIFLPFVDFLRFSDRFRTHLDYQNFNSDLYIKPKELALFLFPLPSFPETAPQGPYSILGNEGFFGPWLPLGVLSALFLGKRRKSPMIFFLGLPFLLIAFGQSLPFHQLACRFLPGFSLLRGPFRFVFVYGFFFSALSAFGWDLWFRRESKGKQVGLASGWFVLFFMALLMAMASTLGKQQVPFLLLIGIGGMGLFGATREWAWGKWIFLGSLLLTMVLTGWDIAVSRLGPVSNLDFSRAHSLFQKIEDQTGEGRVFMGDRIPFPISWKDRIYFPDLPANVSCLFGVRNIGGFNNLSLADRGDLYTLSFPTFQKLMAIQGFATGNEKGVIPGFQRFQWGAVKFYRSLEKRFRVYAPNHLVVAPEPEERLDLMREKGFDPYRTAILSEDPGEPLGSLQGKVPARLDYSMEEKGLGEEDFRVHLDRANWVVFSEPVYPGWRTFVDGEPRNITTSNHLFRGLSLSEGSHLIRFTFQPTCIRICFFGLLAWVLGLMLFWTFRGVLRLL